jgi:hypothetical protein
MTRQLRERTDSRDWTMVGSDRGGTYSHRDKHLVQVSPAGSRWRVFLSDPWWGTKWSRPRLANISSWGHFMPALIRPRLRRTMTFSAAIRRKIQQFGPYKSLAVLLVPLLVVEPVKMAGLAFVGLGHWVGGVCMIVGAYAAGLLVVDRLFRVVKSKLFTMPWCATVAQLIQMKLAQCRWRLVQPSPVDPVVVPQIEALEAKLSS